MTDKSPNEAEETGEVSEERREVLGSLGKWSKGAVIAAIGGAAWLASPGKASAGWLNRRGGWLNRGGGWLNGRGGGGGWVNRRGGGGWLNRR